MDKKESFYWDLVKGAAIFLMLWGHCIQCCSLGEVIFFEDIAYKTIYTFHMPVFMLISGYLFYYSFRKRNLKDLLEHRMRGMLQPIVMATILNNVITLFLIYALSDRVDILYGKLFRGISEDLWFLWAVLYCSLLVGFFCKLTDKPVLQLLLILFGSFIILLVPQWNYTLFMYPYFVAGFYCGRYPESARKFFRFARYAAWVLFPVMVNSYVSKHYIYVTPMISQELGLAASMEIAAFRWAIGFVGSVWILSVMELLLHVGERLPAVRAVLKGLSCLGRNSLQIYCLSASLLSVYLPHLYRKFAELVGGNLFAKNAVVYDFLFTPLLAVCWSVLLYGVVCLMKRCKVHTLIFGR